MVSVFLLKTTSSSPFELAVSVVSSSTTMAIAQCTDNRCATLAFSQGIAKVSISLSFMMWLMKEVPKMAGIHFCKFKLIQDNQSYLVLIIALDSIYLNPDNNIAQGLSIGIP